MIDGKTWETVPGVLEANGHLGLEYRSFVGYSREKLIDSWDILQRSLTADKEIRAIELKQARKTSSY